MRESSPPPTYQVSGVTCQVSHVTCHMSHVTFHMSHGTHSLYIWKPLSDRCFSDAEFAVGKEALVKTEVEALNGLQNIKKEQEGV